MAGSNGCRGEEKSAAAGSALELSIYFLGNTSYARAPSECDRLPLTIVAPCQSQMRLTYQFGNPTPLQLVQSSLTATLALLMLVTAAPPFQFPNLRSSTGSRVDSVPITVCRSRRHMGPLRLRKFHDARTLAFPVRSAFQPTPCQ